MRDMIRRIVGCLLRSLLLIHRQNHLGLVLWLVLSWAGQTHRIRRNRFGPDLGLALGYQMDWSDRIGRLAGFLVGCHHLARTDGSLLGTYSYQVQQAPHLG